MKEELGHQPTASGSPGAEGTDPGKTWDTATPAAADPEDRADAFPVPGWERYAPVRLLGQGGMGRVFLARDVQLDRNVALKFVRGDDPALSQRIVAEARAQARVSDERVCQVYEVGEVRGRIYIAMQYIDGRPLSELIAELTFEEKAIVMRGAALGVAEAHRVGLIHRDLKPSNIMVERGVAGELRPFVLDFGLARDWADATTLTGTVLGTPHYMAPEQARGEVKQLDRRADVYSLGATLYTLLVGRGPFEGEHPLEVLTRVVTDEPARPRTIDPDVPADLEAIAMKCLEKERAARYDSARALADDLGRFLAGEPVVARAASGLGYRLRKRLRRHRRLVAGVTVAVALVVVALGFGLRERWQAGQRADLARRFTERVERLEGEALASALAPAHDLRLDRDRLRRAMAELWDQVRAGGELAAGPGRYALGRGYLALDDDDRAAVELAAAWDGGFHEPRVAYHLALAHGHLYQRELRELARVDLSRDQRAQRRGEIERRHRDPALRYLRQSAGLDRPSGYVAALIAFYEDRFDDALAQLAELERSDAARAWSYEVPLLRGEVLAARAEARAGQGAAAAEDLAASRRALEAAAAIGRSAPAVHRARAELELTALWLELYGGGAVEAPFESGVAAAARALALLPDDAGALIVRARLRRGLAEHRGRRGEDAAELLRGAIDDAQRAVDLDPARPKSRLVLASIYKQWGEVRQGRSEDPSEQLGRAISIIDAIPAAERDAELHVVLGIAHMDWANYQDRAGQRSAAHRLQAIESLEQAGRSDPARSEIWLNLSDNYVRRAQQGEDADGDFARAREALGRARALVPTQVWRYEGDLYARIAQHAERRGQDPTADRARAIESYQQGAKASPSEPYLYNAISNEFLKQAQAARARGRDPLPDLDQAAAAAAQAVAVAPANGYGHINVGAVLLERAEYQRARGDDPMPAARGAEAAFAKAHQLLPRRPSLLWNLADLALLVAGVEVDRGRDPEARARLAQEAIDHALELDPSRAAAAQAARVKLQELRDRWHARTTKSP